MSQLTVPRADALCCVQCLHVEEDGEKHIIQNTDEGTFEVCPKCGCFDVGGGCVAYVEYATMPEPEKIALLESIIQNS